MKTLQNFQIENHLAEALEFALLEKGFLAQVKDQTKGDFRTTFKMLVSDSEVEAVDNAIEEVQFSNS